MSKTAIKNIIKKAIDLHVHIGPEIIPRKFTSVANLVKAEAGKISGMALKNHFYPTQPLIATAGDTGKLDLFGGLVLNNFQGGLNPESVYANALLTTKPTIVWFPTVNAEQFLGESEYEIPYEWVQQPSFKARLAREIDPVKINTKLDRILTAIKENNAVLATGHISWQEAKKVVTKAVNKGIESLIVTHPIYERINFPIEEQLQLARLGAKMEHCYSMFTIDNIPISRIAQQIKAVGAENCIISSDVGQTFSPPPSEALLIFGEHLIDEEISLHELEVMMVKNPKKLMKVKDLKFG